MTDMNIDLGTLIREAWKNTLKKTVCAEGAAEKSLVTTNGDRSSGWIDCLGESFQGHYTNEDQRVFWKRNYSNRRQFNLNELLFDISVCQVKEVPSIKKGTPLSFISNAIGKLSVNLTTITAGRSPKILVNS